MGDRVQKTLETLLPTLLELKAKNLFSEKEIKSIVRKRRNFEYALVGKGFSKEDVLSYIEYEIALEALRKQRAEKKVCNNAVCVAWRSRSHFYLV